MLELLLLDAALYAGLITVAWVMVRRWRRGTGQPSIPGSEPDVRAEPAGWKAARREAAIVPGFGDDCLERDFGARALAEPEQAAESQVSGMAEPDERQAAAGAATGIGRIINYYDEADRPMAEYLAALGWTREPGPRPRTRTAPPPGSAAR